VSSIDRSRTEISRWFDGADRDDLRSFALDVVDISSRFASSVQPFSEILACTLKAALSHGLQFSKLTLLSIKLARTASRVSA
jgi:hypothetical protein